MESLINSAEFTKCLMCANEYFRFETISLNKIDLSTGLQGAYIPLVKADNKYN